jgi:hypothetical protein
MMKANAAMTMLFLLCFHYLLVITVVKFWSIRVPNLPLGGMRIKESPDDCGDWCDAELHVQSNWPIHEGLHTAWGRS